MGMSVVLIGSPLDGFEVVGPFATPDEASEWASKNEALEAWDWWVAPLCAQE